MPPTPYAFDETGMRRAVNVIRRVEAEPGRPLGGNVLRPIGDPIKWKFGYNVSGETIPPFSPVVLDAGSALDGVYHANLNKPSNTFSRSLGMTGSLPIAAASRGGYHTESWLGCYDTGTPAPGETWGPKPGQWTLSKGYPGLFEIEGVWDSTNKYASGTVRPINALVGKAGSDIPALSGATPGSGSVTIWIFDGSDFVTTSMTVTAYNLSASAVTAATFLQLKWAYSMWLVDFESC